MPTNPMNVPTRGEMTYAALEPITAQQLRMLSYLRRLAGDSPTWVEDCRLVLGSDWDGVFKDLSKAAGSYLIHVLQHGLAAVAEPGDDLQIQGWPA